MRLHQAAAAAGIASRTFRRQLDGTIVMTAAGIEAILDGRGLLAYQTDNEDQADLLRRMVEIAGLLPIYEAEEEWAAPEP